MVECHMRALFVVVSGAPGSGKSTLAQELAPRLDLALLMKDTIKEALADELGAPNPLASKQLGAATMRALVAIARDNVGLVIESTWVPELSRAELAGLPSPILEVFVDVPLDVAIARYRERAGSRHPVHFDEQIDPDAFADRNQPINGGWPVIRVDGTKDIDVDEVAARILAASGD
jgi:predicted kinase